MGVIINVPVLKNFLKMLISTFLTIVVNQQSTTIKKQKPTFCFLLFLCGSFFI